MTSSTASQRPITPLTLLRFLFGQTDAIRTIAGSRGALWLGLAFVIVAGIAREYDRKDLLAEPWHLLVPLAASLAISFVQFLLFWTLRAAHSTMGFGEAYRAFLTCFWMTAPLALLYAIPHERMADPAEAAARNYLTLALVSIWRGYLVCRILMSLAHVSFLHAFFIGALLADATMLVALRTMPVPLFDVMGGLGQNRQTAQFAEIALLAHVIGFIALFILLVIGLTYFFGVRPAWTGDSIIRSASPRVGVWAIPILAIVLLLIALPSTQPPVRLARQANELLRNGKIASALSLMDRHPRSEFPPDWQPLPIAGMPIKQPTLLDVAEQAVALPATSWVRSYYLEELTRVYLVSQYVWANRPEGEWARFLALISSLPEAEQLRERFAAELSRNASMIQNEPSASTAPATTRAATQP